MFYVCVNCYPWLPGCNMLLPVESNTKHPIVPESCDEQFYIFRSLSILGQGSLSQRDRPNSSRDQKSYSQSQFHRRFLHITCTGLYS